MPFFGCLRPSLSSRRLKRSRSSARSIESTEVPRIGTPALLERVRELQRRLAAELDDDALERPRLALLGEDLEHVLGGQRLEIEAVGGVVVGRHRLRIAVDHDRFVAGLAQREAGVAAAIVELDALADAVRAAAEDDDLLALARPRFARGDAGERRLVGRVHVGGRRGELGRAGVDALEDRRDAERRARLATSPSSSPASAPRRASEKPAAFSSRRLSASCGRP